MNRQTMKFICKCCGRVEYYSLFGAHGSPAPQGCTKSSDGYHVWGSGIIIDRPPLYGSTRSLYR